MAELSKRREGERGAELIELALVLPILLLVIAGIVDFGFLFQRYQVVTNAAREGARVGVLPGYLNNVADPADVRARVQAFLAAGGLPNTPTITATPLSLTLPSGLIVSTVRIQVDYPSSFSFIGPIAAMVGGTGWNTITLRARATMRFESAAGGGS